MRSVIFLILGLDTYLQVCLYLKQPKRPLCRCGKSTGIQVLGGNEHEKNSVL